MFALPQTLTLAQANEAVRGIEHALEQDTGATGTLTIDAAALANFDTSAIAVLLEARRLAQAAGRTLNVQGAPAAMIELAGIYGVDALLGLHGQAAVGQSALA